MIFYFDAPLFALLASCKLRSDLCWKNDLTSGSLVTTLRKAEGCVVPPVGCRKREHGKNTRLDMSEGIKAGNCLFCVYNLACLIGPRISWLETR